jgi:murein DD-endopeptidase MepM/ murein hydrolase activator NlpD
MALAVPIPALAGLRAVEPLAEPSGEPPAEPATTAAAPSIDPTTTETSAAPSDPTTTAAPAPGSPDAAAEAPATTAPADQTETGTVPPLEVTDTTVDLGNGTSGATPEIVPASVPEAGAPGANGSADGVGESDDQMVLDAVVLRSIRFPVAGPVSYGDDFGNCRDACARKHAGNDIIGLRLQPLVAAADGVVDHLVIDHPTAGWGVVVEDAEGWQYRYFHVNNDTPFTDDGLDDGTWRFAPGVGPGTVVTAGQLLGWMGDSGNSEHSVPHLHFEIRRPDGLAINPYASLRFAQRTQQCVSPEGPFSDVMVPLPEPAHELELPVPGGVLLLDRFGLSFPRGRAWIVGDPRFHALDGPCPAPGVPIVPPIAPTGLDVTGIVPAG